MSFQYVFGNPTRGKTKKSVAKVKNTHKLDNKERTMSKKKSAKFKAFLASKGKTSKKKKSHKRKNPAFIGMKNGKASKVSTVFPSSNEMNKLRAEVDSLKGKIKGAHGKKAKSKKRALTKQKKFYSSVLAKAKAAKKKALSDSKRMKKEGLTIKAVTGDMAETKQKIKGIAQSKGKTVAKKKRKKRKMTAKQKKYFGKKRKTKKKSRKSTKRKARKTRRSGKKTYRSRKRRVSSRKQTSKRRTRKTKRISRRRRKSFKARKYLVKRLNPIGGIMSQFEKYTGHSLQEAGGLAFGGLAYGAINSLMAKVPVVSKVNEMLVKVPVIGTSLPTLLLGAILNAIGEKKKIKALSIAGQGLVGASIVGMGVNASQLVPGLKPAALSGVDYTMNGVSAYMDGVDYTMNGQLGSDADFGEIPSNMGEADFGQADFGEDDSMDGVPQGMGHEGQMG
jgi:hypothetical protein